LINKVNGLSDEEKQAIIEQRLIRFQRTHFELELDLKAQQEIQSEEKYIKATQGKIQALEKSFNALNRELQRLEKDNKKEGE